MKITQFDKSNFDNASGSKSFYEKLKVYQIKWMKNKIPIFVVKFLWYFLIPNVIFRTAFQTLMHGKLIKTLIYRISNFDARKAVL